MLVRMNLLKFYYILSSETHTAMDINIGVVWVTAPYNLVNEYRRFERVYCLGLQGSLMAEWWSGKLQKWLWKELFFILGLFNDAVCYWEQFHTASTNSKDNSNKRRISE
jgi:hypothetical protein